MVANAQVQGPKVTKHPLYHSWATMKSRCKNKNHPDYSLYGARGITVCRRWERFSLFLSDMGLKPSKNHSIDRIDNSKGYSPDNCRWATQSEQNLNRRRQRNNSSGITGVTKRGNYWIASITINRNRISLGSHDDFFTACCARKSAENKQNF